MIPWSLDDLAPADRALWDAMGDATPRFSSMPTPGAAHELAAVERTTAILGQRLLPWQRWATRVITEKSMSDPRRYRFPDITTTVNRQAGKTTITRGILITRALMYGNRRAFYTAQTGKDATERWLDLVSQVEHSPIAAGVRVRKAIGTQRLMVPSTGSSLAPFAPTPESLHGYTPHDVAVDECFSFSDIEGNDLVGAIKPAQQTLPDRQTMWTSTAGHAGSTFLRAKVDAARAATADPSSPIGCLEFSLDPDLDPFDRANWPRHPAYGHLIHEDDLDEIVSTVGDTNPGEYRRAFWNQWVDAADPLYDLVAWRACGTNADLGRPDDGVVFGFAIDADRSTAAIVAAWQDAKLDSICVRTVWSTTTNPGDLVPKVVELHHARPLAALAADAGGLTRAAIDQVDHEVRAGANVPGVEALTPAEWVVASTGLVDMLSDRRLRYHADDSPLTKAVAAAQSRRMGEAWCLSHHSPAPILAMAAAVRRVSRRTEAPAPFIYLGPEG